MSKSIISVQKKIVLPHSSIIEGTLTHGGLENRKFFDLSPRDLAALPALSFNHDCGYASTLRSGHDKRGRRRTLE